MSGRRTRKDLVGEQEEADQEARHDECTHLEAELHARWRRGEDPQQVAADDDGSVLPDSSEAVKEEQQ